MDTAKVNEAGKEILKLLKRYRPGQKNEEAIDEICALADQAAYASDDNPYVREKASKIQTLTRIIYSPRKHLTYRSGPESGAERLHLSAHGAATTLSNWTGKMSGK